METVSGASNWKLTLRRAADHIEILRAETCDVRAVLPDELFGLPVTVLGDHALAPGAKPVEGEYLRILCGREGEWNNRQLQELTLPRYLTDVDNYAFYGCRSLQTLCLHDRADRWGGYCLMNCRELQNIRLTRVDERHGGALAFLCGELHEELQVTVTEIDGRETRLVFPEFVEDYEENVPNHHFDYRIYGGGHPYHHVFRGKQLDLRVYDGLWTAYLKEAHDPDTALRLAYSRLRWPSDLTDRAKELYRSYLAAHAEEALLWQISLRDIAGLQLLLQELDVQGELLHSACEQARCTQYTEGLALLLERQHQQEPCGFDKDFDL